MEKVSVRLPEDMVEEIDAEVENKHYANRSELFREVLRAWLRREW